MRAVDIIKKKRDGFALTKSEIDFFISGYLNGTIPDYQASALLMAIYFQGMNDYETACLTFAVRDSGKTLDFSDINGIRVDKHSTGGVGDKTSLIVAPIVASFGVKVAKMSGRGLGHTGGTIDKLESIDGFKVELSSEDFISQVNKIGIAIISQNQTTAPADKKLYALRDVTATVDSNPLIVSSIMGKKLAVDDDCIVLDVKCGSGAFCKTYEESKALAEALVNVGKEGGKNTMAVITNMDSPLGNCIGNRLEVIEAMDVLNGKGAKDLTEICLVLSAHILQLAKIDTYENCFEMAKRAIENKSAYKKFIQMVTAQGGDVNLLENPLRFFRAKHHKYVMATESGYIYSTDAEGYGICATLLGAGRNTKDDCIDFDAGIVLKKKYGDKVLKGEVIAILYTNNEKTLSTAEEKFLSSTIIKQEQPSKKSLVLGIVE